MQSSRATRLASHRAKYEHGHVGKAMFKGLPHEGAAMNLALCYQITQVKEKSIGMLELTTEMDSFAKITLAAAASTSRESSCFFFS